MDAIFKEHPNLKEYHKTSDGENFYNEGDAKNHAKTLKDRKVETFKRVEKKIEKGQEDDQGGEIIYEKDLILSESTKEKAEEARIKAENDAKEEADAKAEEARIKAENDTKEEADAKAEEARIKAENDAKEEATAKSTAKKTTVKTEK